MERKTGYKKWLSALLPIAIFIILSNIPPLKWIYAWHDQDDYNYTTYDGSFTFSETQFQRRDFRMCKSIFIDLTKSNELPDSSALYRLNKNRVWKFWRWGGDYLFKEKYRLHFIEWSDVDKRNNWVFF
jgi:hypothetical protein